MLGVIGAGLLYENNFYKESSIMNKWHKVCFFYS